MDKPTNEELEAFARGVVKLLVATRPTSDRTPSKMELSLEWLLSEVDTLRAEKERRRAFFAELAKEGIVT